MTLNDEDELNTVELTDEERTAFAALPRELAPSELLEERVVRALRATGTPGAAAEVNTRRTGNVWRVAAAIALFVGGVATGRYLLAPETSRSAIGSPQTQQGITGGPAGNQNAGGIPARNNRETVVALEMWL